MQDGLRSITTGVAPPCAFLPSASCTVHTGSTTSSKERIKHRSQLTVAPWPSLRRRQRRPQCLQPSTVRIRTRFSSPRSGQARWGSRGFLPPTICCSRGRLVPSTMTWSGCQNSMRMRWQARHAPSGPLTIVPLAIVLAVPMQSAESAILLAATVGGDSDSVASVAGSILGARCPGSINEDWYGIVEAVNDHRLTRFGEDLSALRS